MHFLTAIHLLTLTSLYSLKLLAFFYYLCRLVFFFFYSYNTFQCTFTPFHLSIIIKSNFPLSLTNIKTNTPLVFKYRLILTCLSWFLKVYYEQYLTQTTTCVDVADNHFPSAKCSSSCCREGTICAWKCHRTGFWS